MASIYHPLNTDLKLFRNEFENLLQTVTGKNTNCVLAGNYNINLLNQTNSDTTHFIDMLYTYSVPPEIKTPTRYGEHGMTFIDNNFTNKLSGSSFSGVILNDLSDHLPIFYVIGNYTVKHKMSYNK